jgi:hypothetical protein
MNNKIEKAIDYYTIKSKEIIEHINSSNKLTAEEIIQGAEELAILEYKLTALEVAKAS